MSAPEGEAPLRGGRFVFVPGEDGRAAMWDGDDMLMLIDARMVATQERRDLLAKVWDAAFALGYRYQDMKAQAGET